MRIVRALKIVALGVVISVFTASTVYAQCTWEPDGFGGYRGGGDCFGRGWEPDGFGGWRGTGDNFGRGWEPDGFGGSRGTGDNFGRHCQPDGFGGTRCNY